MYIFPLPSCSACLAPRPSCWSRCAPCQLLLASTDRDGRFMSRNLIGQRGLVTLHIHLRLGREQRWAVCGEISCLAHLTQQAETCRYSGYIDWRMIVTRPDKPNECVRCEHKNGKRAKRAFFFFSEKTRLRGWSEPVGMSAFAGAENQHERCRRIGASGPQRCNSRGVCERKESGAQDALAGTAAQLSPWPVTGHQKSCIKLD